MSPAAPPPGCPMHVGREDDTTPSPETNGSAKKCPFPHAATAAAAPETDAADGADAKKPLECPMGFGAGGTAKLDPLNCIICRTLYFDAAQTACHHVFCRFCIAPCRDCPICGADCQPLSPDAQMQETVDKYIDVHSKDHKLVGQALAAPLHTEGGEESAERSTAAFMLQLGLRSFAGGNIDAASHRLSICEQQLRTMLPDADAGRDAAGGGQPGAAAADEQLSIQLGAVCGSLGDCHRRLGNAEEAASSYRESVVQLQQCAVPSDEVKHALSVSLNKLGDLQHWRGDVRDACHCYQAALSLRRELAQSANEERGVGMQLDLAVSLIKVANAEQALDDADLAQPLLEEARKMTEDIAGRVEDADKASMAKLRSVQAYFDSTT